MNGKLTWLIVLCLLASIELAEGQPRMYSVGLLSLEQPTKFEFMINLKAAKQIGLMIPPDVLARADRVIK